MKRPLAILSLLLAALPPLARASDDFPLTTLKDFQRTRGLPENDKEVILDSSLPGLSTVVRYAGAERPLPDRRRFFLGSVAKALDSDFFRLYTREIKVKEQDRSYWIPMQDAVLESFRKEIDRGGELTIQLRYLGAFGDAGHLFLAIDFARGASARVPHMRCFGHELAGVRIGEPFEATRRRLEKRYGEAYAKQERQQRRYHAFVLDRERRTMLIIGDAGASYRERVFSVQVSGPANPGVPLVGPLRLGASPKEVEQVLGRPIETEPSGDGYTQLSYPDTDCSVELKGGRLASMLILGDPNYFEE